MDSPSLLLDLFGFIPSAALMLAPDTIPRLDFGYNPRYGHDLGLFD